MQEKEYQGFVPIPAFLHSSFVLLRVLRNSWFRMTNFIDTPVDGKPGLFKRVPLSPSPCIHEGRIISPCAHGDEGRHVRVCKIHGACMRKPGRPAGAKLCQGCADYSTEGLARPHRWEFHWVSTADLVRDSIHLAGLLPLDCSGIVGVPRSGMIPASVIATHLHLPLYSLIGNTLQRVHSEASRGAGVQGRGGPLAVVDDTTFSGAAMQRTRGIIAAHGRRAVFCAVYVNPLRPESKRVVDLYVRELPAPHLLEWNWANNGPMAGRWSDVPAYGAGMALDLDGIIVHDSESGGRPGSPYMLPRALPCKLIATGRPESDRAGTESMLRSLGVQWERLEMYPGDRLAEWHEIAAFKARLFKDSACGLFVESDRDQAERINQLSGKPCICPRAGVVYHGPAVPIYEPGPRPDDTSTDGSHLQWMYRVISEKRPKRVLEIGCHVGYSTAMFIHALRAGFISELHLCDTVITPEVRDLVEDSGLSDRIHIHEEESAELLARWKANGMSCDFVYVDGDHTSETGITEASYLLDMRPEVVFVHDVNMAGESGFVGPAIIEAKLRYHGYRCEVDSTPRPGEWCQRGMLYAARDALERVR
jgi:hypothetical protein